MKSTIWSIVGSIIVAAMAGCAHVAAPPATFDIVTLPGTGDSTDLLRAITRAYAARYPDRQVLVPDSISTDGGIRVVGTGEHAIGRVARLPNAEERAKYGEFQYAEFARVPVVFVVGLGAGVRNLTEQQVCAIYRGDITSWKQVGGNDLAIHVQARPDYGSNMKAIDEAVACFVGLKITPHAHFNKRNADLVATMKAVPGALGFMPLGEAQIHGISAVSLGGVAPDRPQYKISIGLGFVYKQAPSPSIQAFLDYLQTEPALEIMRRSGHVPVAAGPTRHRGAAR